MSVCVAGNPSLSEELTAIMQRGELVVKTRVITRVVEDATVHLIFDIVEYKGRWYMVDKSKSNYQTKK